MSELRAILFLATFFATAWTITNRRALYIVLAGLFILADLTASIVVVQQFFGRDNVLLSAMLGNGWYLRDVGGTSGGFGDVRVVPPGNVLMFMVTIVAFALLLQSSKNGRLRLFFSLQFIYLCIALLFTYTRAQWIATAMGVALIVLVLPRPDKALFARYMVGIVLVFGLVYGLFEGSIQRFLADQPFVANITDRALSIFTPEQTLETNSLEWRIFENGEALKSIEANPILGVGLGNAYRNITLLQWENRRFYFRKTRFVHNSYLYVATKMGLPGLASFFILSLSFLLNGWKVYRKLEAGTLKRIMIALLTGFVGLLFWSNSQMHLMTVESTAVIGLLLGLAASVGHIGGVPEAWAGAPEAYTASQGSSPRTLPAGVRAT